MKRSVTCRASGCQPAPTHHLRRTTFAASAMGRHRLFETRIQINEPCKVKATIIASSSGNRFDPSYFCDWSSQKYSRLAEWDCLRDIQKPAIAAASTGISTSPRIATMNTQVTAMSHLGIPVVPWILSARWAVFASVSATHGEARFFPTEGGKSAKNFSCRVPAGVTVSPQCCFPAMLLVPIMLFAENGNFRESGGVSRTIP